MILPRSRLKTSTRYSKPHSLRPKGRTAVLWFGFLLSFNLECKAIFKSSISAYMSSMPDKPVIDQLSGFSIPS